MEPDIVDTMVDKQTSIMKMLDDNNNGLMELFDGHFIVNPDLIANVVDNQTFILGLLERNSELLVKMQSIKEPLSW